MAVRHGGSLRSRTEPEPARVARAWHRVDPYTAGASNRLTAMAEGTYVSELEEGALVEATFAVQRKRRRRTRNGDAFLSLELADRTGRVPAVVWNDVNLLGGRFDEGDTVRVLGRVETYDGRPQIAIRDLKKLEQGNALELVPGARRDAETLDGMLEFLADEIHDPDLSQLVARFLANTRFRERLRTAPAS